MSSDGFGNYEVEIMPFAERHYIKSFRKKYKKGWEITQAALQQETSRIDNVLSKTDRAETIQCNDGLLLVKMNFRVAGTTESAKRSGNRAIIFVNSSIGQCKILLVYSKKDICQPNETQKWQNIIKENYPEIWKLFC